MYVSRADADYVVERFNRKMCRRLHMNVCARMRRGRRILVLLGGVGAGCLIAAGAVTLSMATSSHEDWQDVGHPTAASIVAIPTCSDQTIAAEVSSALSGSTESTANSVLLSPSEATKMGLRESQIAAQTAAWNRLSTHDRAFQLCLGAEQEQFAR